MNTPLEIEVFRAGDYGSKGIYTPDALRQIADDYDPAAHEAPVTLDHRQDGPAFGWVESLRTGGDRLIARLKDLHESLREWIQRGAYKKRSIELYRAFPATGRPYLRAVSFLGACPPEVKGLADPVFREDDGEHVVVEFEEPPAASSDPSDPSNSFAAIAQFCETERLAGRILPAWERAGLAAFMLSLDSETPRVESADGRRLTSLEWFKEFLRALPPQVPLHEIAPTADNGHDTPVVHRIGSGTAAVPHMIGGGNIFVADRVPKPTARAAIRPASLALHERALAFCRQNPAVSYVEALQTVSRF
ncbi:MAG: hypothetical protein N3D11_03755 [Candidatus Sumerlaeia bacterium]|nr:hypothetical protein [Candidatus Sumerlaeia bacterium]